MSHWFQNKNATHKTLDTVECSNLVVLYSPTPVQGHFLLQVLVWSQSLGFLYTLRRSLARVDIWVLISGKITDYKNFFVHTAFCTFEKDTSGVISIFSWWAFKTYRLRIFRDVSGWGFSIMLYPCCCLLLSIDLTDIKLPWKIVLTKLYLLFMCVLSPFWGQDHVGSGTHAVSEMLCFSCILKCCSRFSLETPVWPTLLWGRILAPVAPHEMRWLLLLFRQCLHNHQCATLPTSLACRDYLNGKQSIMFKKFLILSVQRCCLPMQIQCGR